MPRLAIVALSVGLAAACSSVRETSPPRSASEQLLLSGAVDDALRRLRLDIPAGTRVWVEVGDFEAYDQKYAIGAFKDYLLQRGALLVFDRGSADTVVAIRSGALSIEDTDKFVGLPGGQVPTPLAGKLNTPEIAVFRRDQATGVAKLGVTAINARTGALEPYSPTRPIYGFSQRTRFDTLLGGWTRADVVLPQARPLRQPGPVPQDRDTGGQ